MERRRGSDRVRNRNSTHISDNSVNNNGVMRKPLSELINFDIIPTQTLRKLCSNNISPSEAQSILRKSQVPNLRFSQLPSVSETHAVPDYDSRSATSISSSNTNAQTKDQIPVNRPSSSKGFKPTGDKGSKTILSSHAKGLENLERHGKTDVSPSKKTKSQPKTTSILTPSEKWKDKRKGIAIPFGSTSSENVRDNSSEKAKDKGKGIALPFYCTPTGNVRDIPPEKANDEGKGITRLFDSTSSRNLWDIPLENAKDRGKGNVTPLDNSTKGNVRDKQKESSAHFSSPIVERTFDKKKAIYVPCSSTLGEKRKDEGKTITDEGLEDVEKSTPLIIYSRSSRKTKENRREDAMIHSCPPRVLETRNIGKELDQRGESKSKSWTDPPPKAKKRKYSKQQPVSDWSLPEEFVKAQNAYFAEIDAFELPVELASDSD